MVQLTGELGQLPERVLDLSQMDPFAGSLDIGAGPRARRPHDLHGDPALADLSGAPPGPRRGGGDDRRRADPEPRHDRGQRDQRLTGGRHAAGPARLGRGAAGRRPARRAIDPDHSTSSPTARPRSRGTSCSGSGSCSGRIATLRFRKVGTRRAQAISKVVIATAWRRSEAWSDVRIALGSVAATPIRVRRPRRRRSRARARPRRSSTARSRPWARSSRSTTSARRPPTVGRPPAASRGRLLVDRWRRRDRARSQPLRQAVDQLVG